MGIWALYPTLAVYRKEIEKYLVNCGPLPGLQRHGPPGPRNGSSDRCQAHCCHSTSQIDRIDDQLRGIVEDAKSRERSLAEKQAGESRAVPLLDPSILPEGLRRLLGLWVEDTASSRVQPETRLPRAPADQYHPAHGNGHELVLQVSLSVGSGQGPRAPARFPALAMA